MIGMKESSKVGIPESERFEIFFFEKRWFVHAAKRKSASSSFLTNGKTELAATVLILFAAEFIGTPDSAETGVRRSIDHSRIKNR